MKSVTDIDIRAVKAAKDLTELGWLLLYIIGVVNPLGLAVLS